MQKELADKLSKCVTFRPRYELKAIRCSKVPTNYGMRDGVALEISHSTMGSLDMKIMIYIPATGEPISKSYLESGGILVESIDTLGITITNN